MPVTTMTSQPAEAGGDAAEYEVLREHLGDKQYQRGDKRTLARVDGSRLVALGVLKELGNQKAEPPAERNKREPPPLNKAEPAAPVAPERRGPGRPRIHPRQDEAS